MKLADMSSPTCPPITGFIVRCSTEADLPSMMRIIHMAQAAVGTLGVDQWQDGYPTETDLRKDMALGWGHVLEKDGQVIATAAISFEPEPTYEVVEDGEWTSDEPYAVVHRVAVDDKCKGQGLTRELLHATEQMCRARGVRFIRIDTHPDNSPMRRMLEKNGFTACGTIYIRPLHNNFSRRVAYERQVAQQP